MTTDEKTPRSLAKIDYAAIQRSWSDKGCAVSIVQRDVHTNSWDDDFFQCHGPRDEAGNPVTENTRFQIASISKLFCAIAIGIALSENGFAQIYQTRIKDIAAEYELTDKAVGEQVTVEDALAHMTGLPRHDHFMSHEMHDLSDLIEALKGMRLSLGYREANQYHNVHYDLIALLVERITGIDYPSYVRQKILDPLGMEHTSVQVQPALRSENYATGFWRVREEGDDVLSSTAIALPCGLKDSTVPCLGAGKMSSTIKDMATWMKTLLSGGLHPDTAEQVLPRHLIDECMMGRFPFHEYTRPSFPEYGPALYGMGLAVHSYRGETIYSHVGELAGWMGLLTLIPGRSMGTYIVCNDSPWGGLMCENIRNEVLDVVLDLPSEEWQARLHQERLRMRRSLLQLCSVLAQPQLEIGRADLFGIYRAPGFHAWKIGPDNFLDAAPTSLVQLPWLPFLWGSVRPMIWFEKECQRYRLCFLYSFPAEVCEPDQYGNAVDMEPDWEGNTVRGFGIRGIWGAGHGVPSPSGKTARERAEMYFHRSIEP